MLRNATGPRWWLPTATEHALGRAIGRLHDAATQWSRLDAGDRLRLTWAGRIER